MQPGQDPSAPAPYFSSAGFRIGARYALVTAVGACVFALAFGTLAAQKGLSLVEATLMSALVFAGASQLVAMEIWTTPMTPDVIVTLALVTAVVNLRFVLMGAALRPWLAALPPAKVYPALLMTTDSSWIIALRHRGEGGADAAVLLGSSFILWTFWVTSTALGYLFGSLIPDPRRFALDLILPIFFVAMLVPLWRGPRKAMPWVVAGAVALVVQAFVPGFWFIVAGSLSGALAGGFLDERE